MEKIIECGLGLTNTARCFSSPLSIHLTSSLPLSDQLEAHEAVIGGNTANCCARVGEEGIEYEWSRSTIHHCMYVCVYVCVCGCMKNKGGKGNCFKYAPLYIYNIYIHT